MNEVDDLLTKWFDLKETITKLESKMKEYKVVGEQIMIKNNTDELKNKIYCLKKKEITRSSISKDDLPDEIWERYSKKNTFSSFYISKNDSKRSRKRSVRKQK